MSNDIISGVVGPSRNRGQGSQVSLRLGPTGEMTCLHGRNYEKARNGQVYTFVSATAGITPLKFDNTAPALTLWNQSVDRNLIPLKLQMGSVGTPAVSGSLGFAIINAGYAIGTGAPFSAFTKTTAYKSDTLTLVEPVAGKVATTATAAAPATFMTIGFSSAGVLAAASTTTPWVVMEKVWDGEFIVPPGFAIALCGNVAQSAAFSVTLSWAEELIS